MEDLLNRSANASKKQNIVFFGEDQECIISDSHIFALEREFPGVSIKRTDSFDDIIDPSGPHIALLLVEPQFADRLRQAKSEISQRHPRAAIALLQDDRTEVTPETIRQLPPNVGILPMDLRLDLWLAAVRIMLLGGCYYPPSLLRASLNADDAAEGADDVAQKIAESGPATAASSRFSGRLTTREEGILEMVSRGEPNKSIASTLGISEHTVKLHLHKIIGKLGVRNRTEAAISYLGWRSHRPNGPAAG